jgi:PEP-CTERM motif
MKACCSILSAAVVLTGLGGQAYGVPVTVFEDAFETHTIGDQLNGPPYLTPPVGEWGFTVVAVSPDQTIQADPDGGGGQSLRTTRPGTGNGSNPGFQTARTLSAVEADTIVTVKWDWFRADSGVSGAVQGLFLGGGLFADASVDINGTTQELRSKNSGTTGLGVSSGWGGWESLEMVITFGPDILGQTAATYDLFFERLAGNSQGVLPQTQLLNDEPIAGTFAVGAGNMRWFAATNAHFLNSSTNPVDATWYFDNIQITTEAVPEPASLMLCGSGLLVFLGGRRRRLA